MFRKQWWTRMDFKWTILQLNNDPGFNQEVIRKERIKFGGKKWENTFVLGESILYRNKRPFSPPQKITLTFR